MEHLNFKYEDKDGNFGWFTFNDIYVAKYLLKPSHRYIWVKGVAVDLDDLKITVVDK